MFPDFFNAKIGRKKATDVITDEAWLKETFVPKVGKRELKLSLRVGHLPRPPRRTPWSTRSGTWSCQPAENLTVCAWHRRGEYGTPEGIITSLPVKVDAVGNWRVVEGIELNEYANEKIAASNEELIEERRIAFEQLGIRGRGG